MQMFTEINLPLDVCPSVGEEIGYISPADLHDSKPAGEMIIVTPFSTRPQFAVFSP